MLAALQKFVTVLRDDLRDCLDGKTDEPPARAAQLEEARARVRAEFDAVKQAERTAQPFATWREDYLTQVAVAWVLACVFVRYLEDNGFVGECWLGGPDDNTRDEAKARHGAFFRPAITDDMTAAAKEAERERAARLTDRDYLLGVFRRTAAIPAASDLFAEGKTPLWVVGPSADAATKLVNFWHERDKDGVLPTFVTADGDTRFLGDLYQDLSEDVRKKYALLQTPVFVEEFILDRTLTPACGEFGFQNVRLIDPTCGSGHFLLGAFDRLMRLWQQHYQQLTGHEWNAKDAAGRVLGRKEGYPGQVFGVDINPYAVAIARFRLLIAACKWCGVARLKDAPEWAPQVFCGDSLYHGHRWKPATNTVVHRQGQQQGIEDWNALYHFEDVPNVRRVLSQKYHAVVGNPPYITVRDAALSQRIRERYDTCHQKYSLGVPFTERFWDLCVAPDGNAPAGFVGLITTNSFMKREFGCRLIEWFFPQIDLTYVIDTSGAYIPGHGTPTVILFGRNQEPERDTVRAVLGIKGEPSKPDDAAQGQVWCSIVANFETTGVQTEFVSVTDIPRPTFAKHPWSIGGGGAAELKEQLEEQSESCLVNAVTVIGVFGMTNADEVLLAERVSFARKGVEGDFVKQLQVGDELRDWSAQEGKFAIFPYGNNEQIVQLDSLPYLHRWIWPCRAVLGNRATFNKGTYFSENLPWWKWHQVTLDRLRTPLSITFAFVATHNHFVLDCGGKVFKQSAPIIKLPVGSSPVQHTELLGLLNSSTACFWMKQTFHNKGSTVDDAGARQRTDAFEDFYEFTGTGLQSFPLPAKRPLALPRQLDALAQEYAANLPSAVCKRGVPTRFNLVAARERAESIRRQMIYLQEELDWECYHLYGLTAEPLTRTGEPLELNLGERAFEIALARSGEKTAWFERHRSTPITALPPNWPDDYRALVERRLSEIESNPNIKLIERPEYKRRWASETWDAMEQQALRSWLLDRLETDPYWPRSEPSLRSCDQLANVAAGDPEFLQVAALYKNIDTAALIRELVTAEAVPYLPVLRYKDSGLRKRVQWEETWALQRREDAGEKLSEPIPVPPKYASGDFLKSSYWSLRGKLDVPKERWVIYPGAERDGDPTPVVAWAGYDHLEQARALAGYYQDAKGNRGWAGERLIPLLAGLDQLVPWLKQWHNEFSEEFGEKPGDAIDAFVTAAAADLRVSRESIRAWKPEQAAPKTRKKKA